MAALMRMVVSLPPPVVYLPSPSSFPPEPVPLPPLGLLVPLNRELPYSFPPSPRESQGHPSLNVCPWARPFGSPGPWCFGLGKGSKDDSGFLPPGTL